MWSGGEGKGKKKKKEKRLVDKNVISPSLKIHLSRAINPSNHQVVGERRRWGEGRKKEEKRDRREKRNGKRGIIISVSVL